MKRFQPDQVTGLLTELPAFTRQRGARFVIMQGPDRGEVIPLDEGSVVTFGASPSCTFTLADKTVSRQHLEASWHNDGVVLRDMESTNGTFFEGSRIKEITIRFGAEFKLGRTVVKLVPDQEIVEPQESEGFFFGALAGQDPKMRRLFALLADISDSNTTIIIEGETGTGKELVAEEIHNHSHRSDGPFVVFDCGAVPRDLIESSLFGHVKGSFTGAISDRQGAFADANGGTIFLDEIGELSPDLQPALLRALDKRSVRQVGGNTYSDVDVRVLAATNRDLRQEVAERRFREDLYYRLAVIRIELPPLRERGLDIPFLGQRFIEEFSPEEQTLLLAADDMTRLQRYNWPGNVRELRNAIERACVLARDGKMQLDEAFGIDPAPALGIRTDLPFKEAKSQLVEQFEREYVLELMRRHQMNLSSAAREAQIDRKHLRELIRKYEIDQRK